MTVKKILWTDSHDQLFSAFARDGIDNFDPDEFIPRRSGPVHPGVIHRIPLIARVCQDLRDASGDRVSINSAYRSPAYNASIGGAEKSQHPEGTAADVVSRVWTPDEVADWAEAHSLARLMGIGRYRTFTHLDVRGLFPHTLGAQAQPAPARWDNR